MDGQLNGFIEPSTRDALIKGKIREITKRIKLEYRERLNAARGRSEKKRLKAEMEKTIRDAIQEEGLIDTDHDPRCLY